MAYLDHELKNARIVWNTVADRVVVIGLIVAGITIAHAVSTYMGMMGGLTPLMP